MLADYTSWIIISAIFIFSMSEIIYTNPLAELIKCILNSANGPVVNEVYILQNGECTNFANDFGKQTIRYFLIISDDQELVCKL